ncbi:HAMP domain-containing histidine kinase [Oculatella sp. LEGE 06141]|uniref:sensor histidine kinase n=1 Tax=Oculatella sp. LEGE 06141 TaxID=1828648 RepID=UPI001882A278|nr:HAMP domain-containing sensor histidine kinase [Oculatella sp. LEGE 06141]MBE9179656.1 HAMP domain-containing histidine kinase [Oculatella sp. LEGE 06141]
MKRVNSTLNRVRRWWRRGIDPSSLQLRLSLGVAVVFLAGVSGIGLWTTWDMRQMLVVKHEKHLSFVADRLAEEIEQTALANFPDASLQPIVDRWSSPTLWIWVKQSTGEMAAYSSAIAPSSDPASLPATSQMSVIPKIYQVNDQYWVVCKRDLQANGQTLGRSILALNITHDYTVLSTLIRSLNLAIALAIFAVLVVIVPFVWRLLYPLRQAGQLAGTATRDGTDLRYFDPTRYPSEVKELVQTCSHLSDRLWETGQMQREFTNNISHELRTSLSVVYGYLQSTLRRGSNLSTPQKECLGIAVSEIEQTIQLLQDLLNLARTDSGSIPFSVEPLILNEVVAETMNAVEQLEHRVVQLDGQSAPITVMADRTHLAQALVNLLDNAARFSAAEQPITVKLYQTGNQAAIQVCDRGCGIPPSQQVHIFEPFYRVDPSRSRITGGVGLGLAIAKSLVKGMGGQLTVWSEPGQGSIFTITLPAAPAKPLHPKESGFKHR